MTRKLPLLAAGLISLSGWIYSPEKPVVAPKAPAVDTTILNRYRWRSIGPDRGGRSIAISGVRGRPNEGYFGATGGGLWKTTDAGENWVPVTDGQITSASVGAVAVSETNQDIVWIGMGEACIRGNIMPGDGVYKSTDAGKTWTHMGFRESDAIAKIRIHPKNPDIVFVASFGKYGGPSADRGIFKTSDGGKTWKKVLYRDDKTGGVDISIDPSNPDVMYAALWEAFRTEWTMSSGGPGSGLFKSTDGGETWTEITRNPGFPSGLDGKIGVAVSPADPNRVYALIENDNGGLFSSDNAGATWTLVNPNRQIRQRAFYYTHVAADTKNKDIVYMLNVGTFRSTDGGKTMQNFAGGDSHDLWIDPDNSEHVLHASDGGGAITTMASNPARTWTSRDYPTPQIYRIIATTHQPFHVCGAQQDASSYCISTADLNAGAGGGRGGRGGGGGRGGPAPERLIYNVGGSEDGYMAQDPLDPDIFYVGTNANGGGFLNKVNRSTGDDREVSPYPRMFSGEESAVVKERWQWTYPIVFSKFDPKALYVGSQRLWMTRNGGQDWTALSGDLTRHDPKTMGPSGGPITRDMNGPEIYGVIFTIAPGKVNGQTIWTGSDDGLIYVTKNGGTTWTNVTPKDMPDFGRVSIIDASAFNAGTAYAAVKRPLLNDRNPYIFRTRDYGATWTKITNGIRQDDYVHTVREDPYQKGVLYAGTQQGVYISYNDGDTWESLSLNLPMIPVSDLVVMPNDIAISTHGRGFYVLDRVNPLRRAAKAAAVTGNAFLFAPAPAMRATQGATIQYLLKSPAQGVKVEVMDTTGRVIRTFGAGTMAPPADPNAQGGRGGGGGGGGGRGGFGGGAAGPSLGAGINTVSWDLRYPNAVGFPGLIAWGGGLNGPTAAPGKYKVKLTADNYTQTEDLVVVRNPLMEASDADLRAQFNLAIQIRDKVSEANNAVITIRDLKTQIADRLTKSQDPKLKAEGDKLTASLADVEDDIYQVKNQAGQDPLNYPIKINNRLMSLLTGVVNSGEGRPVGKVPEIFTDLKAELAVLTTRMDRVISTGVPSFNSAAKAAGVEAIVVKKPGPVM